MCLALLFLDLSIFLNLSCRFNTLSTFPSLPPYPIFRRSSPRMAISTDHVGILAHFWQLMVTPSCQSKSHEWLSRGWHISPWYVHCYRYTAQRCLIGRKRGGRDAECFIHCLHLLLILVSHVNYQMLALNAAYRSNQRLVLQIEWHMQI